MQIKVVKRKGQLIVIDGNSRLTIAKCAKLKNIDIEIVHDLESIKNLNSRLAKNDLGERSNSYPSRSLIF